MSFLIIKASHNLTAANQLLNGGLYLAPVVHCSYYACVQLMIENLNLILGEETVSSNTSGPGSHEYLIKETLKLLQNDQTAYVKFNNTIGQLKSFRKNSDYKNIEINRNDANLSLNYALELKAIFRNKFNLLCQ